MKKVGIAVFVVLAMLIQTTAHAALLNPKKSELNRRNALRAVASQAVDKGRAPIPSAFAKVIRSWDANGNGYIDRDEGRRIEAYLDDLDRYQPV